MAKNTYLSTIESKKQSKQRRTETESRIQSFDGCQMEWGCVGTGGEVRGLRSTNRLLQNGHGDVKYGMGNGVAEELTCMTHGHELKWGNTGRRGCAG